MSIAPVQSFPPARSEQPENAGLRSGQTLVRPVVKPAEEPVQAVSGILPKQEESITRNVPSPYEAAPDVVELHQDPEIKDQIIIQYLDQAKNVILQVPSNEELNVERSITQEFQQAAKLRASEATGVAGSEGGKIHGD